MLRDCIELTQYVPGKSIEEVRKKYGLKRIVKLASNENPYGPSPKAINALRSFLDLHIYPDPSYSELRERLSEYTGWEEDRIVVSTGIDGILETIFSLLIDKGDEVLIPVPTFPYYHILTRLRCGREVLVKRGRNFRIDESVLNFITKKTKIVIVCSPNNPTGNTESEEVVRAIAESTDGLVFVDEAYIEFSDSKMDIDAENVVIARTFSKAFGLANLRIGYARLPDWLLEPFRAASTPFPVSTPAERAAIAALDDVKWMQECVERIRFERERVYRELKGMVEVHPSQANFLFFRSPLDNLAEELLKKGVIVRDCRNFVGCDRHIRVTVGKPEDNDMFLEAVKEVLGVDSTDRHPGNGENSSS
ncbi:histidinol-phosphate transaminase [Archaeoglobus neptunius]|uniref:histidinol-phosphate transaminase n=1 Tax=Archaeoglobus neptunius TaxID=2798580 RepID=UPI001928EADC|nr:histidinol-phosphate transaminase [Archaeoglobus neptunius]